MGVFWAAAARHHKNAVSGSIHRFLPHGRLPFAVVSSGPEALDRPKVAGSGTVFGQKVDGYGAKRTDRRRKNFFSVDQLARIVQVAREEGRCRGR
jgi:hypothetical protein